VGKGREKFSVEGNIFLTIISGKLSRFHKLYNTDPGKKIKFSRLKKRM